MDRIRGTPDGPGRWRFRIDTGGRPLTWAEAALGWRDDRGFRARFVAALTGAEWGPFGPAGWPAWFWETPAVERAGADRAFEWMLIETAAFAGARADPAPFGRRLDGPEPAVAFDNLGRDARLIVPTRPPSTGAAEPELAPYAHLASFVRRAPPARSDALWTRVGTELLAWFERTAAPVWVSTSGLGVHWVHVRLDARPKYVTHAPYRRPPRDRPGT